jgi:hypothetical protein
MSRSIGQYRAVPLATSSTSLNRRSSWSETTFPTQPCAVAAQGRHWQFRRCRRSGPAPGLKSPCSTVDGKPVGTLPVVNQRDRVNRLGHGTGTIGRALHTPPRRLPGPARCECGARPQHAW